VQQRGTSIAQNTPDKEVAMTPQRIFLAAQQGHPVGFDSLQNTFNSFLERLRRR
jgi:hypothetical protein